MNKNIIALLLSVTGAMTSYSVLADDLLSVYQQALSNDPVVLKAKAEYQMAKEDIDSVRAMLLPNLSAIASYQKSDSDQIQGNTQINIDQDQKSYGLNLSMQLYHHSSWLQLATSKKMAHLSDISLQSVQQDLIMRVAQAYFNLLAAKDDLDFATAEKVAIERQLEQTKQRFSVGLTAITDVHEAQAQFDYAVTKEIQAENSIFTAEEALRVITNIYPRQVNTLDTALFSTSKPVPATANEWQQLAEAKNLAIIGQKVAVDIAKEGINISRSGHYPTLSLSGNYNKSDSDSKYNNVQQPNQPYLDSYSIGVNLNVPIYSGGAITSATRKAQQSFVATSQDLALAHRGVIRDTRNAFNTVVATISAIKALDQSVLSAQKALEATEAGFEVGTRTIVDVLNSTRNLYNARRNLSSTRYQYIQSVLSLKRAAGTISEQDLVDINKGLISQTH